MTISLSIPLEVTLQNDQGYTTRVLPPYSMIVNERDEVVSFTGPDTGKFYFLVRGREEIPMIPDELKKLAVTLAKPVITGGIGAAYGMRKGAVEGGVAGGVVGGVVGLISSKPVEWLIDHLPPALPGIRQGYYSSGEWHFHGPLLIK